MIKYDTYKDSGIEWLGEIPEHWQVDRLKSLGSAIIGITYSPLNICDEKDGILVLRSSNIQNDNLSFKDNVYVDIVPKKKYLTKLNDILICSRNGSRRLIGKNVRIDKDNIDKTFGAFMTIYRSEMNDFISYFFKSVLFDYQSGAFMTSTINQLTIGTLNLLHLPIPPLNEQIQIANYLDKKTNGIDRKIELLSKKINTYKELRKSIINETVINGLDEKTKWQTCRLKDIGYIFSGLSGKSGDDFNQDNNENNRGFIPFTNIANNTYLDKSHLGKVVINPTEKQNQVKKDDLFFLMSSEGYEDIGKSAVLKDDISETYLNSFCKGFRITKENISAYFLNYLLLSSTYREKMIVQGKGFTRINLKIEKVNNFSISIPTTLEEQKAIANYLDEKTSKIDAIVSNIEKQITHLKELRKALINDVVTGKIKVVK